MAHETFITVRFGETDALGHVNNVSYFIYFEQARVEFFKSLGYRVGKEGYHFVLVSTSCDYIKQAFFDQDLIVETSVLKVGNKSFQLQHQLFDQHSKELITKGVSVIVILDAAGKKSIPLESELKERLLLHQSTMELSR